MIQVSDIEKEVKEHKVILYGKGDKGAPMCGFTARAMQVLEALGYPYEVRNVLTTPGLREALVEYSKWPTTPQVFIGGELIGGSDIVVELYEKGELQEKLKKAFAEK